MKKFILISFCLLAGHISYAATLDRLINNESKKSINFLNKEDLKYNGYKYQLYSKNIIHTDINKDGKKDAVVALYYCEKQNCHMTTRVFDVAVFLGTGKNQYKYGDAYTLGLMGDLTVKNGIIYANVLYYIEEEDPACCPSHKQVTKLKFSNGNLIKIR